MINTAYNFPSTVLNCVHLFRYGGKNTDTLTTLRHAKWDQRAMTSNEIDPATLPPSETAAHFHSLRVYLEMSRALALDINCGLDPCQWGWERVNGKLKPVMTDLPPAPDFLLKVIHCNCKTTSANTCGTMLCKCRKNGLTCVQACGNCRGVSCQNGRTEVEGIADDVLQECDERNPFESFFDSF